MDAPSRWLSGFDERSIAVFKHLGSQLAYGGKMAVGSNATEDRSRRLQVAPGKRCIVGGAAPGVGLRQQKIGMRPRDDGLGWAVWQQALFQQACCVMPATLTQREEGTPAQ
jgi:hypothetical protein